MNQENNSTAPVNDVKDEEPENEEYEIGDLNQKIDELDDLDDIDDDLVSKKLNEFENLGFVTIKWYSPNHNDLNYAVDVTVLKDGINYFADKKKNRTSNRRDWTKTYIPITISFIALLKSFDTEIIWLWKQLMQLLK